MSTEVSLTPQAQALCELFGSSLGINKSDHANVWAKLLKERSFGEGMSICARGRHTSSLFLVKSGELVVSLTSGSHTQEVTTLSAGSFFGELGLLAPGDGSADVICRTDCELLELDSAAFELMKKEHAATARALIHDCGKVLALRVMGLERVSDDSEQHNPKPGLLQRISNLLFHFGEDS